MASLPEGLEDACGAALHVDRILVIEQVAGRYEDDDLVPTQPPAPTHNTNPT